MNKTVNESYLHRGATDNRKDPRFDEQIGFIPFAFHLLPREALAKVSTIMRVGELAGRENEGWKDVPVNEHLNHAISHILSFLNGDETECHLSNAGCRILMALDLSNESPTVQIPIPASAPAPKFEPETEALSSFDFNPR